MQEAAGRQRELCRQAVRQVRGRKRQEREGVSRQKAGHICRRRLARLLSWSRDCRCSAVEVWHPMP